LTDGQHRGREYFETLYRIEVGWITLSVTDHLVIRRSEEERYLNIEEVCLEEAQADQEFQKVSLFIPRQPVASATLATGWRGALSSCAGQG
jgi:hypothetical protein